ncbi:hypothetical protein SLEP1_g42341 [Rubroshorea leprosula]|uniref:Reverse transcriptase domain-containing protein n=1 Tax=Rubroshorea leprosula TaxID=152421 RepID=A0AAV5L9I2_9ROSI|nr:hypothetical protein SLEP1_g42341 [Rubroshorea leprosula]
MEEIKRKLAAYLVEKHISVDKSKVVHESEEEDLMDEVTLEELDLTPAKLDDLNVKIQDLLKEVNLGIEEEPKIIFIKGSLKPCMCEKIINILHEYKDCFAWVYLEMPGLDQKLVEHRLPIKEGTTYQRAINAIFHDMIDHFMEIYIDDLVVKSDEDEEHLKHLKMVFERMRMQDMKMNPLKCAFGVSLRNFLGYLVHERGLEVNFLRRFILNLARRTRAFSPLLKLKAKANFMWEQHHQTAFDEIK